MKKIIAFLLALVIVFSFVGCSSGKSQAVKDVEEAINAIGEVSLSSKGSIDNADSLYKELSSEDKEKVENYDILKTAKSTYKELEKAEAERKALEPIQNRAGDLLILGAHLFQNPLSVKVINAWYSKLGDKYYFTYELEVKNSSGIVETVYYGNSITVSLEDDDSWNNVIKSVQAIQSLRMFGGNDKCHYFEENEIRAMQNGKPLNADELNTYFKKNYK